MEPIKAEVVDDKAKRDRRGRQIVAAQRREELLAEYDASGLTQAAFARRAGINFHTLVAWLGRRRQSVRTKLTLQPEALAMLLAGIDLKDGCRKAWYKR